MSYPLEHVHFSFEVVILADMHIGDGGISTLDLLRPGRTRSRADGESVKPEIATIVRDHGHAPTIPATALKGALRKALMLRVVESELNTLFGRIREQDDDGGYRGGMGRFSFYAGKCLLSPPNSTLPLYDPQRKTWIATHVAISEQSGTAENQKLFNLEMVPADTTFSFSGIYFGKIAEARQQLERLLAPLAAVGGLAIGSGAKLGRGTIKIRPSEVKLTIARFDPDLGEVAPPATESLTIPAPQQSPRVERLSLYCKGPFASIDPDATPQGSNDNRIRALRRYDGVPVLHPDSVIGALRARAAWLGAVGGLGEDQRFANPTWQSPAELNPVRRLFGVTGWRGLLRIARMSPIGADEPRNLTGIALDRFSGAVLDGAIFVHEMFIGVRFELDLVLDGRQFSYVGPSGKVVEDYPFASDTALFKALLLDIRENGLMLGHGTNRGFGWFEAEKS